MIEKSSKLRSTIIDNFNELQIIIPAKRNYFVLLFISFWMTGWFFGEGVALGILFLGVGMPLFAKGFLLVWFSLWTIGGFYAMSVILWMLSGKEIITIENGILNLSKTMLFFKRGKSYDIYEITNMNLAVEADESIWTYNYRRSNRVGFFNTNQGKISFDYGYKTVRFANDVDRAEARVILDKIKQNPNFKKENFEDPILNS